MSRRSRQRRQCLRILASCAMSILTRASMYIMSFSRGRNRRGNEVRKHLKKRSRPVVIMRMLWPNISAQHALSSSRGRIENHLKRRRRREAERRPTPSCACARRREHVSTRRWQHASLNHLAAASGGTVPICIIDDAMRRGRAPRLARGMARVSASIMLPSCHVIMRVWHAA